MFDTKTVFVVGAGASWHYGYPTGEELVHRVIEKTNIARRHFNDALTSPAGGFSTVPNFVATKGDGIGTVGIKEQWINAIKECDELATRLRAVDPLVIDYFLGHNRHLEDIGKLCIAWVLLEREAIDVWGGENENRLEGLAHDRAIWLNTRRYPDNWCRFLIHKLVTGCPSGSALLKNKVTFVTFNYDVSLEIKIHQGLNSLSPFESVAKQFLGEDRVLHVYGKIREDPLRPPRPVNWRLFGPVSAADGLERQPGPPQIWTDAKTLFDAAFDASNGLQIIAPDKVATTPTIEKARKAIAEAECVYILGYGFDRYNNNLLNLPKLLRGPDNHKKIMFTNFNNRGTVNKNASRIFFGRADQLLTEGGQFIQNLPFPFLCEKSIRNVYEALAYDFDSPEERP